MRKRILAVLLAGLMMFHNESIITFAAENESRIETETAAETEAETESRQQTETETDNQGKPDQTAPEKESVIETQEESSIKQTESETGPKQTEEASETESAGSTKQTEETSETESETGPKQTEEASDTESKTETETETESKAQTETESETQTEEVSETESETQTEEASETESETETEEAVTKDETEGDFDYSLDTYNNATITKYRGNDAEVVIPDSVGGNTVTAIGSSAFYGNSDLTRVTIPDTVTKIGSSAFYNCKALTTITIPKSVTSIGSSAFYNAVEEIIFEQGMSAIPQNACNNASKLTRVVIPDTVAEIGESAFYSCNALKSFTVPKAVTNIGSHAFYNGVEEITFEQGMTTIPKNACYAASKLTNVVIPDTVAEIGESAFYNCNSLESITIPQSVVSINKNAFSNCSSLEQITINSGTTVLEYGFKNCSALKSVIIGDNASIGNYCFNYCSSLNDVSIGNNVTLGDYIFQNCRKIEKFKIGQNLTKTDNSFKGLTIGGNFGSDFAWRYAFDNDMLVIDGSGEMPDFASDDEVPWSSILPMMQNVNIGKNITSISSYAFKEADMLGSVQLGRVTAIRDEAFFSCGSLTHIEISSTVKLIGKRAFADCGALREIVFCGDAPSIGEEGIPNVNTLTAYYPETGSGWERPIAKFPDVNWQKWDNTVPSKDVVMVLDRSGSMSGKMDTLKDASAKFIRAVGGSLNNTRIAVVAYDNQADVLSDFTTDQNAMISAIQTLTDRGGTEYARALNKAHDLLQNSSADYQFIMMFSDGQPNDNEENIRTLAAKFRDEYQYNMYTVGLISNGYYGEQQKQILVDVAGSEERYFEASNIDGLVEAFLALADDLGKSVYTTVEIKRQGNRYDLLTQQQDFCVNSKETVSIYVTPGKKYTDVETVTLEQNGQQIAASATGEFENITPGTMFALGSDIYVSLYNARGELIESQLLKLNIREQFVITYMLNDGTDTVYKTQKAIGGEEIMQPDKPERAGYVFKGWFQTEQCTGIPFFSDWNETNRLNLRSDITLYAKWKNGSFNVLEDAWSFTNSSQYFNCTTKEITPGDYHKLTDGLQNAVAQAVYEYKIEGWSGSCFGMSSAAALMKAGVIAVSDFDTNYTMPGEVTTLYQNRYGDSDVGSIESMINFYHLRQMIGNVNTIRSDYSSKDESKNIEKIINKLKSTNSPVVLGIQLYDRNGNNIGGHAVIAYNLEEEEKDNYKFNVYDCSWGNKKTDGTGREYTVTAKKEGFIFKRYVKDCADWENEWNCNITLKYALTIDDLQTERILAAPGITTQASAGTPASDAYTLYTGYDSFSITDGTRTAVITGAVNVTGDLPIECYDRISEVDAAPVYRYELPVLSGAAGYTITVADGQTSDTQLLYTDAEKGFYASVDAEKPGEITITASGEITTKYAQKTQQRINAAQNSVSTSWYNVSIKGEDTGFAVQHGRDNAEVKADNDTKTAVTVNNSFNDIEFQDIPLDSTGVIISEGADGACNIDKDGRNIATSGFGYSVVFDSCFGTPVDTIKNMKAGSLITEPQDPLRDGYVFEGWYKQEDCTEPWDFATDHVTGNTILYAGWSIDTNYFVAVEFRIPGYGSKTLYTAKGSQLEPEKCPKNDINATDTEWYKDSSYARKWDFANDIVMENTILYAKGRECQVTFETGCATRIDAYTTFAGDYIKEPDMELKKSGYTLCGWTSDAQLSADWNFKTEMVVGDTTLYAKWIANEIDKKGSDTEICIEIVNPKSYVYTGKAVTPRVIVRDGGEILELNKDYKITYKNNKAACDITDEGVKDSKKPQITIKGIGAYKSAKGFAKYFSIRQADISSAKVTVPEYIAAKANGKLQKLKPTVQVNTVKLSSKEYNILYYKDAELKDAVNGLGAEGTYYVVAEAKEKSNYTGRTKAVKVSVCSPQIVLSGAKVSYNKKPAFVSGDITPEEAVQKIITSVTIGGTEYKTSDMETFKKYFAVSAIDTDGKSISQAKLARVLKAAGTKTIRISALNENEKGYVGEKSIQITVQGAKLKKSDFKLTYNTAAQKAVTSNDYTGKPNTPEIVSTLQAGTDYTVSYVYNNKTVNPARVVNAGKYTAVIKGINQYSGTVSLKFTISRVNLAKAYKAGKISITSNARNANVTYSPAGAVIPYVIAYNPNPQDDTVYRKVTLAEGRDYRVSVKNNRKVTKANKKAYAVIKGSGNFTGSLKGDGRNTAASSKNGIANELNYTISRKSFSSDDISVVVNGLTFKKNGNIKKAKFTVYDNGVKIPAKEYTSRVSSGYGNTTMLYISAKSTRKSSSNYSGSKSVSIPADLIKATDTNMVTISYKEPGAKYYYTGKAIQPEIIITDASGKDISENFTVIYGSNTKIGKGTVRVAGNLENGYCGEKVLKFTILPRWAQWIF